jgi:hypothetical protein
MKALGTLTLMSTLLLSGCIYEQNNLDTWGKRFNHPVYYNNTGYYTPVNAGYYPTETAANGYYHYLHDADNYNNGYYNNGFYGNEYYHMGFFNNGYYNPGVCESAQCKTISRYHRWQK